MHSFEIWKAEQIDDLKQNWLPLAGLYWLRAGVNSFGSAGGNAIVFPAGPAHAGGFSLESKDVTFKLFPEAHGLIAGKPITAAPERLDPDISGHPSTGEMGGLPFHVIVRGDRVGNPRKDLSGATARHFHGLMLYPLDIIFRVTATGVPSDEKKTIDVPNVLGDCHHQRRWRVPQLSGSTVRKGS